MSIRAIFSDWAGENLPDIDWTTGADVKIRLDVLLRCPSLWGEGADPFPVPHISAVANIADFRNDILWQFCEQPDWIPGADPYVNQGVSTVGPFDTILTEGSVSYVPGGEFTFWSDRPIYARGFLLSLDAPDANINGKVICFIQPDVPVYLTGSPDDPTRITAVGDRPDAPIAAPYLFSFLTSPGIGETSNPQIGPIGISVPSLEWENARSIHVWLDPQRINYAVNPSFERGVGGGQQPFGWRSNSTMDRPNGGVPPWERCVALSGDAGGVRVLESLPFPLVSESGWWSLSAMIAGTGRARIGLVCWDPTGTLPDPSNVVWSKWVELSGLAGPGASAFKLVPALLFQPETVTTGLVRIEIETEDTAHVDNVIAEPNEAQLPYFDASWEMGQNGDFSWYGDPADGDGVHAHASYSLFYNNRRAVTQYLFAKPDGDPGFYHVLSWVPEDAHVIPHWDDVFSARLHSWIDDIYIPTKDFPDKGIVTELPEEP